MDSDVGKPAPGGKMTDAKIKVDSGLSFPLYDDVTQGLSYLPRNGLEVGFSTTQIRPSM